MKPVYFLREKWIRMKPVYRSSHSKQLHSSAIFMVLPLKNGSRRILKKLGLNFYNETASLWNRLIFWEKKWIRMKPVYRSSHSKLVPSPTIIMILRLKNISMKILKKLGISFCYKAGSFLNRFIVHLTQNWFLLRSSMRILKKLRTNFYDETGSF